jgi:hypothetical protein
VGSDNRKSHAYRISYLRARSKKVFGQRAAAAPKLLSMTNFLKIKSSSQRFSIAPLRVYHRYVPTDSAGRVVVNDLP